MFLQTSSITESITRPTSTAAVEDRRVFRRFFRNICKKYSKFAVAFAVVVAVIVAMAADGTLLSQRMIDKQAMC